MKKMLMLALVPVVLAGCTSTYKMDVLKSPAGKLQRNHAVVIQVPQNGSYGETVYQRSGQMTADALKAEFLRYSQGVDLVPSGKKRADYSGMKASYYVQPNILQWEERATEWSGRRDKIKIKVDVYDTGTMSQQSSVIFSGRSKWATFGGDHPQDLLPKPIQDYLKTLY